jgi:replication factor C subunit 2/4
MKLEDICEKESFNLDKNILRKINDISKGDTRKSIIILQNLKYIYDYKNGNINKNDIYNITGYISEKLIKKVFQKCIDKNSKLEDIFKIVDFLKLKGYPVNSILFNLNKVILDSKELDDDKKSKIFYNMSLIEKKLNDGADEYIQLTNVFSYIFNLVKYPENKIEIDIIA